MGGTFPARGRGYQEEVLRGIYDGLNGARSASLAEAQATNEQGAHRVVGLTVETRPDWCDGRVLPFLLDAGRHPGRDRSRVSPRGGPRGRRPRPRVGDVARATREARDRGLKVGYHLMLGLPGMDPERDLADFRRLWGDPDFRPDFLKIYPTLVLPGTALFEEWSAGRYEPYETATAADLLASMKRELPPWVRIQRIQRDIPARLIAAGVRTSNLRQIALARLAAGGGPLPVPAVPRGRVVGRRRPRTRSRSTRSRVLRPRGTRRSSSAFEEPEYGHRRRVPPAAFPLRNRPRGGSTARSSAS